MAEAALSFLLEELKEVLKWYKDLLSGSENEFEQLIDDLSYLKAFLRGAGNKLTKDKVYKEMEWQIKEVVYDVEDKIETCLTKAAEAKERRSIRRRLTSTSTRVRLADEVKSLRKDKVIPVLKKVRDGFAAPDVATAADQPPERPRKDRAIRQDKVVGFEDEEATLIGYLTEQTKKLDVISIISMPGLGKTTLAWKIFENERICYEFPIRIWVYVSQRFNSRDAFLNILRKFTSNDMSVLSDEELAHSVRACLAKEKFLLVMDDVWSPEVWKVIQNILPMSNGFSKVMITSRDKSVGTHANVSRDPHMLRFFRLDESWKLLQLEVFDDPKGCPPELETIGVQIAGQCYGVPLTVVVVGGILVDLFMKRESALNLRKNWINVSENMSEFIQDDTEKRISDVVELSYNILPDYLRDCFLYMAVFPQEYVISAWTLTRLWIAEGFIQRESGKTLEEIAEENLDELISRNLLMTDRTDHMGKIKTCRVQSMIHAFCKMIALDQNFFQEIRKSKLGVFEPPASEVPRITRLCCHSNITDFLSQKPKGVSTRSLLCFNEEPVSLDPRYISSIPDAFVLLRVLESRSIKFNQFPAKVTKLIHLKYITLNIDNLNLLPEPLSWIWNLQTLVIETKSPTLSMKANIWRMYQLRNLKTKAAIVLDRKKEGEAGDNLHTMSSLSPESCTAYVPDRACNLKTLGIRGNLAAPLFETMSLEKFAHLEKLKLVNDLLYKPASESCIPLPNCFPPNLKRLTLSNTSLEWSQMSALAKINTLEVLKLKHNAFVGIFWRAIDYHFPTLQLLLINGADLVHWVVSPSSFPQLQSLVLQNCENLNQIPSALASTLKKLVINRVPKSAVESAQMIEEEKVILGVGFKLDIVHGIKK